MINSGEYLLLSEDNIEECQELTGLPEDELKQLLEDCINFAKVQVFWRQDDNWCGYQVSMQYQHLGILDRTVREIIERHARESNAPNPDVV